MRSIMNINATDQCVDTEQSKPYNVFEGKIVHWSQNVPNGRSMCEQVAATIRIATVFY